MGMTERKSKRTALFSQENVPNWRRTTIIGPGSNKKLWKVLLLLMLPHSYTSTPAPPEKHRTKTIKKHKRTWSIKERGSSSSGSVHVSSGSPWRKVRTSCPFLEKSWQWQNLCRSKLSLEPRKMFEYLGPIVQEREDIIWSFLAVYRPLFKEVACAMPSFLKVLLLPTLDVVKVDWDEVVPVRPCMLVDKAECVK